MEFNIYQQNCQRKNKKACLLDLKFKISRTAYNNAYSRQSVCKSGRKILGKLRSKKRSDKRGNEDNENRGITESGNNFYGLFGKHTSSDIHAIDRRKPFVCRIRRISPFPAGTDFVFYSKPLSRGQACMSPLFFNKKVLCCFSFYALSR